MRWTRATVLVLAAVAVPAAARGESVLERRLRRLEGALEEAQAEIRELRRELEEQKAANRELRRRHEEAAAPAETAKPAEPAKPVETAKTPLDVPAWLRRLTLFGDVRVRHEGFYNQPHRDGQRVTARNRERIRARAGLRFTYSDELSATIRLATGDPDDPISTNQTLTDVFSRKNINLDWAFVTFAPGTTFGLRPGIVAVTAGKHPIQFFRPGEMVFDEDLAPEGFSETIALLAGPRGGLEQVRVHLMQWTFEEVSNAGDGWMIGGQVNPVLRLGTTQVEMGLGQYWFLDADLVARELNTNSALTNTNLLDTRVVDGETVIVGYRGAFNMTHPSVMVTVPDALGGHPLRVFADYVYNWEAATSDAHGVQGGFRLGQTTRRGDLAFTASYEYLQREAVLSAFSFSDFGFGGTNQQGPVFALDYQLLDPITLTARTYVTNFIARPVGLSNDTLFRLQLDAQLRF